MDAIYEKYNKYVEQINRDCLIDITYPEKMEILRYCERKTGNTIPTNMGCATCVFNLIKLFVNLKDK
jgi:hypothetical protein